MKKMIGLFIVLIVGIPLVFGVLYYNLSPQFGGKPMAYKLSGNYKNGGFVNQEIQSLYSEDVSMLRVTRDFFFNKSPEAFPAAALPTEKVEAEVLKKTAPSEVALAWLGHSSILLRTQGLTFLFDPVLTGKRIPPLNLGPRHFPYTYVNRLEDLGPIDAVLISHDHLDHLDMETIKQLKDSQFFVPLGIKSHLLRWGVSAANIKELDWYDEVNIQSVGLILTPAQHFSGRGLFNRNKTLWGSFVLKTAEKTVFFSGDTGYTREFVKIGQKYGPFDLVMLDTGQYNQAWRPVHLMPEEMIQAGIDLDAAFVMPIHNSKYILSQHAWYEPLDRSTAEADRRQMGIVTPKIGQVFVLGKDMPREKWWK